MITGDSMTTTMHEFSVADMEKFPPTCSKCGQGVASRDHLAYVFSEIDKLPKIGKPITIKRPIR